LDDDRHSVRDLRRIRSNASITAARERPIDRIAQVSAANAQDALVLSCERAVRSILRDAAGADSERPITELAHYIGKHRRSDAIGQAGDLGRKHYAVGHADPVCDELAEASSLAANSDDIGQAHVG
jgi:hypothetical protein